MVNWVHFARFLMLKNNFGAVREILQKIAEINGRVGPEGTDENGDIKNEQESNKSITTTTATAVDNDTSSTNHTVIVANKTANIPENTGVAADNRIYTYLDLFRYPSVRRMSIGAFLLFFVSNFCYYGTLFALNNLHGSIYWNGFFMALAEYTAYLISIPILKRVPRKKVILVTLVLTVLGSIGLILFSNPQANWYCELYGQDCLDVSMEKVFAMFIKFNVAVCNTVLYVYSNELFPTAVKSLGLGWVNTATMLGSLLASANEAITNRLGVNPMTTFIILCILTIIYFNGMPETKDKAMEDEIEELKEKGNAQTTMNVA